jgi:hypothetical protein
MHNIYHLDNLNTPITKAPIFSEASSFSSINIINQKNPLSQFEIRDLVILNMPLINNLHLSITNITEYLAISFMIITMLYSMTQKHGNIYIKN